VASSKLTVRSVGARAYGRQEPCRDAARLDALAPGPADVVRPPEPLEAADELGAAVELPAVDAVARGRRVGVVQVVPRLAHRDHREGPDVARLVAGLEGLVAEGVADRVDRPRDVVEHARRGHDWRRMQAVATAVTWQCVADAAAQAGADEREASGSVTGHRTRRSRRSREAVVDAAASLPVPASDPPDV
jgi:hypothetical protein